ncbi:MAG: NAD(P)-binding protein [Cellvibrionaceae bacterium]|nr:NAD(P)-binding protein [Cellvibrionaceae bacterium]
MKRLAIIGAGLSGLSLATILQNKARITVFEKSRGVGGRMSTRRGEVFSFDHGAQYFTAREPAFQDFIRPYIQQGIVKRWDARYARFDGNRRIDYQDWRLEEPRYVGSPTMNSLLKSLAASLNVELNCRISVIKRDSQWQIFDEKGRDLGSFDWIISTAPPAQTIELFPEEFSHTDKLSSTKVFPCFALMLGLGEPLDFGFEAAHVDNSDISWLAVNSSKPERNSTQSLVAHSSVDFAHKFDGRKQSDVSLALISAIEAVTGKPLSCIKHQALHYWRYASSDRSIRNDELVDRQLQLAACGDWTRGGRVEGAFMSALNLASSLEEFLE